MKRTVPLFLISLILLASCSTTANIDSSLEITPNDNFYVFIYDDPLNLADEIIEMFEKNGLKVEPVYNHKFVPQGSTPETSGTGFFISPSVIVTNEHVVSGEADVTYYVNGNPHHATPLYVDEEHDLAFLMGESNDNPYFALGGNDDYDLLTSVFALGYPLTDLLGNNIKVTNGVINSLSGLEGDTNAIQISAQLQPGSSGGPVVNSSYKVIGMASSKLSDAYMMQNKGTLAQNVNFAIKSDLISFFGSDYITGEDNYVSNLREAMNATVKIEAGGTEIIPGKQYGIDFSYRYTFDVIHWTLTDFRIYCYDMETGDQIADARFTGDSIRSGKGLAKQTTNKLLKVMGLKVNDDEEE